jgi:ABC-type glycerol-3-phosphate transport system substrate-binding protein
MPHINSNRRKPAAATVLLVLLACLGLAACGGSSKSSSTSTSAAATTSTRPTGTDRRLGEQAASRFKTLRACLQKNGITLPTRTPGQRPPAGSRGKGGFLGGAGGAGPELPSGVTRAQYETALKKCGGGHFASDGGARFNSPAFKAALTKFATCLRQNGVNVPAPNTSGKGPVFDTKGIDTSSAQFKAAETKCSTDLRSTFRRGAGPGRPPNGTPPPE